MRVGVIFFSTDIKQASCLLHSPDTEIKPVIEAVNLDRGLGFWKFALSPNPADIKMKKIWHNLFSYSVFLMSEVHKKPVSVKVTHFLERISVLH